MPSPQAVDPELMELAVTWAREAGHLTLGHFRSPTLEVDSKGDGTPVTVADRQAELLLRDRIAERFPEDAVRGEEHADTEGSSGRTWVIDPIDGTSAFSHGVGTYSNLLYLEDEHGPAVGVINLPALGETVWAGRGRGCLWDGRAVAVRPSGEESLRGRFLTVSGTHCWDGALFDRAVEQGVQIRTWGDAYGYALVATGRVDAMFDPLMEWWDLAAVAMVIREAGATITRRDGDERIEVPGHDGAYPYSAVASSSCHDLWVELLAER
jgi:histidinol-phosphatase